MRVAVIVTAPLFTSVPFTYVQQLQERTTGPDTQPPLPPSSPVRLEGVRDRQLTFPAGEPVVANLTRPLYIGEDLAVASAAVVPGHVLAGDFTPPRSAKAAFDQITLTDGTKLPFYSEATAGPPEVKPSVYRDKHDRPAVMAKKASDSPVRVRHRPLIASS